MRSNSKPPCYLIYATLSIPRGVLCEFSQPKAYISKQKQLVAHSNTTLCMWHSSYWVCSVHVFSLTLLPWKRNSLGSSYCSGLRLLSRNTSAVLSSSIFFLPYLMVCDCTWTLGLAWHPWTMQLLTSRVAWVLPSLASICARQGEMNHSTFLKEHSCLSPLISLTAWFTPSLEWR